MTKEEARREIDSLDYYLQNHTDDYGEESHTAMMMAIKALEQEPCNDAVSRQEVIDTIFEQGSVEKLEIDFAKLLLLQRAIKKLPSVTPTRKKGEWIDIMVGDMPAQACDQCNTFYPLAYTGGGHKYCPNCGCFMSKGEKACTN